MKKVFRVGVSDCVNNWLSAGNFTIKTEKEGVVHVETLTLQDCHGIDCAYYSNSERVGNGADLFIMPWSSRELLDHEEFVIRRLSKPQQHVVLARLAKEHFEKYKDSAERYFLPIPTYTARKGNGASQYNHPHDFSFIRDILFQGQYSFTKRIVIKPTDGARSMGQVIFNSSAHTLSEVMAIIDPSSIERKGRPDAPALISDPDEKAKDESDKAKPKKYNIFAETKLPEGINVFLGDADPEEALRVFNSGHFMQHEVNCIAHEYRLLVGPDGIYSASSRPRGTDTTGDNYKAVTKEKDTVLFLGDDPCDKKVFGHAMTGVANMPAGQAIFEDMHTFITDNIDKFAYNSIDIFVTENGQWGIFEYCNQFSIADYGVTKDGECNIGSLMRNWLTKLVVKHIDG